MKKAFLLLISIFSLASAHSQDPSGEHLLISIGSKNLIYVEFDESTGTVFKLGRWMDKGGSGYSMTVVDTITKRTDTHAPSFEGQKTRVREEFGKWYITFKDDATTPEMKIELAITPGGKEINTKINNAYWWTSFFKLCDDLDSRFAWNHNSFRNGFHYWDSFDTKESDYKDFMTFANEKIRSIKDSVTTVETARTRLAQNVINSISTIQYSALKDSVSKLPVEYDGGSYFRKVVNVICIKRPEAFFYLADDLPGIKGQLFSAVDPDKQTIKTLKAIRTNSPSKKEFFKERRQLKGSLIWTLTLYSALLTLGILAL